MRALRLTSSPLIVGKLRNPEKLFEKVLRTRLAASTGVKPLIKGTLSKGHSERGQTSQQWTSQKYSCNGHWI